MIRLPAVELPAATAARLARYQRQVDAEPDYPQRVAAAKRLFAQKNRPRDPAFKVIRESLAELCSGARRCCYCEDSAADEVEHVQPKDLYPELVFAWLNYVYACGPCNGPKNSRFAVIDAATTALIDVTRGRGAPMVPPSPGPPALINPRTEDPLVFLDLDIVDTFIFLPALGLGPVDRARAEYTIDLLHLNDRDLLIESRRNAYGSYRARLVEYHAKAEAGGPQRELSALVRGLKQMPHPTVWSEMKRRHAAIAELRTLFEDVPQALSW